MNKVDRLISIIRSLKEEGAPTMSTASTAGKAGFGGSEQGFDPGPTAGYDKPLKIDGRSVLARGLPPPYRKFFAKKKTKSKKG
jgi:hypothetical protein